MAKFEKGHKKVGGKTIGTPNVKTQAWEQLGDFITETGAERAKEIMQTCTPEKFMIYYPMLLEYFKPKQNRTQTDLNINQLTAPIVLVHKVDDNIS